MTTPDIIANLEKLIGGPRDGALLRYSLGNEYMKRSEPARAADCFQAAVAKDVQTTIALLANNDPGISRVPVPPDLVQAVPVRIQVAAGSRATALVAFTPPSPLPLSLSLSVTTPEDPTGGVWMASLYNVALPLVLE